MSIIPISSQGLLLSYYYRFDCGRNFNIYFFFTFGAFLLGNIIWLLVQNFINVNIPQIIFTIPLIMLTSLIISLKRNEHVELFRGLFHDVQVNEVCIRSQDLDGNERLVSAESDCCSSESDLKKNFRGISVA